MPCKPERLKGLSTVHGECWLATMNWRRMLSPGPLAFRPRSRGRSAKFQMQLNLRCRRVNSCRSNQSVNQPINRSINQWHRPTRQQGSPSAIFCNPEISIMSAILSPRFPISSFLSNIAVAQLHHPSLLRDSLQVNNERPLFFSYGSVMVIHPANSSPSP